MQEADTNSSVVVPASGSDRWLGRLERGLMYGTAISLVVIATAITVDVFARYLFNAPLASVLRKP